MPLRLATPGALRALSTPGIALRAFSALSALSAPLREAPLHPHHHHGSSPAASSSSDLLLSISGPARRGSSHADPAPAAASTDTDRAEAAERMVIRHRDRTQSSAYKNKAQASLRNKQALVDSLRNQKNSQDYLRQMPRRWDAGDVYSPHDMSPVEMQKWRKRSPRRADVVDALGIRPLDMYKNFSLVQEFTSTSGQITHSSGTSLRPVNQRKIAKMIRRVQGMGIYPTIHDHPEMIRDDFFPEQR